MKVMGSQIAVGDQELIDTKDNASIKVSLGLALQSPGIVLLTSVDGYFD